MVGECGLADLDLKGYPFTWEKGRGTNRWVEVRLDRGMADEGWLNWFKYTQLYNLEVSNSDHCPILLIPVPQVLGVKKRGFKFENAWMLDPMCRQIVQECWENSMNEGIQNKIKACAGKLEVWGKEITGHFGRRIRKCKDVLQGLKGKRDARSVEMYEENQRLLFNIYAQKEKYWKQRVKQFWLREGDQNSRFFHASASTRRKVNQISKLKDQNGNWVEWDSGLDKVIVNYFVELFSSSQTDCQEIVECIPSNITAEHNGSLLKPVEDLEVKRAIL